MAIEFSRDITFGQFLDLRTPIHRLDPRTKMVIVGGLMVATMAATTFAQLIPVVLALVIVQIVSRIPLGYTLRGLRLLMITAVFLFIFQVLFYRNPPFTWWQWSVLSLSPAGLIQGALTVARIIILYQLITLMMLTTSLVDLADGVEIGLSPLARLGLPINELVMTMVVALKFVPLLVGELERLVKAQAARGDSFDQGGPIQRARKIGMLLVPLFVGALNRADVLTTAMNARCYRGGRGRTKRRILRFQGTDALALLIGAALVAASFLVRQILGW